MSNFLQQSNCETARQYMMKHFQGPQVSITISIAVQFDNCVTKRQDLQNKQH